MEGSGKQSRLLGRLLGKLRGEHRLSMTDKNLSFTSTGMSENIGCGSDNECEDETQAQPSTSNPIFDEATFAANVDLRYSGQYLTPEQLPEFCNQLHHLVEVIRNIQSYAKVTGEYPSDLERRLEREAREVAALASEARNAYEVVNRVKVQRQALRQERVRLLAQVTKMREAEIRELESTVRLSDRKLYKSWEAVKDSSDPAAFDPLSAEIRAKQLALENLERLIETRCSNAARKPIHALPLPPHNEESSAVSNGRKRHEGTRRSNKRRRKDTFREPRSEPLSQEPSRHEPQQVTLYIQGSGSVAADCPRLRAGSAAAVTLGSLELPNRGSVRDILFFTST
ncbi:unnamed protein product [Leptidea sinapis]|uniref:Uncharacterized protein n=1 Tax=Leptidea sinapis TaxID=189913 RepID=A0A5E4QQD6_9NEOP|nr:unnamed protein product [Leptidea sinapis]